MKNKTSKITKKRARAGPSKRTRALVEKLNKESESVHTILAGPEQKLKKNAFENVQNDHQQDQRTKSEKQKHNDDLEKQLDLLSGMGLGAEPQTVSKK
ncbi:hypothetical protein OGAPHI_007275 [Ogataea philodendri]|uniref:Uncharacterized protein n=1 Tax=Ogataea philodendri TaxID=1378263 RepID=A0A9P8NV22_9ASCO|nr:uncharacterized protein OGAPHI_007275 [Ogataea philodendri]KAH3660070.1 hypothetical protein OGAPHI_007275 [Ogataea philodendri]